MAKKLINCKSCGAEMAPSAKACPKCGAKNKKPIYKKWWFYAIIVIIAIGAIGSAGDSGDVGPSKAADTTSPAATVPKDSVTSAGPEAEPEPEEAPEEISYVPYSVTELFDALDDNALKAERTFQNQYVELYGYLANIDSDGKYISIGAGEDNWDYVFQTVQCYIKNDAQIDQIIEMSTGDAIMVRGKITDIGEILGYTLDIDSIG